MKLSSGLRVRLKMTDSKLLKPILREAFLRNAHVTLYLRSRKYTVNKDMKSTLDI